MDKVAVDKFYLDSKYKRFDQKYDMFNRPWWDSNLVHRINNLPIRKSRNLEEELKGKSLSWGGIYLDYLSGSYYNGHRSNQQGLYRWDEPTGKLSPNEILETRLKVQDFTDMARQIKLIAFFYGASLCGICRLDKRWVYSKYYESAFQPPWNKPIHKKQNIPDWWRYIIVLAIEMNYDAIKTSPGYEASAEANLAYSKMGFISGSLAAYIRGLGFNAIPSGNDTVLSIPCAIDAGMGQLGRNGLLITRDYGPRVRLCKVITDLPLKPDVPVDFGVDNFCMNCTKCATHCPSKAISFGEKTFDGPTISNNSGTLKHYIDPEKCKMFWITNSGKKPNAPYFIPLLSCSTCIKVCHLNKYTT